MESDGDDVADNAGFSKQGGEALNLDDDQGFNDSEDVDESDEDGSGPPAPQAKKSGDK